MTSKTRLTALAAAAVLLSSFAPAIAQESSSVTAYASAQLIAPVEISKFSDLAFGTLVVPKATTNFRLSPLGELTAPGIPVPTDSEPADFMVTGQAGMAYSIVLPEQIYLNNGTVDTNLMVDQFVSDIGNSGKLDDEGYSAFLVGATLHVPAGHAPGKYFGTFDVQVAYE